MNKLTYNRFIEYLGSAGKRFPAPSKFLDGFLMIRTSKLFDDKYSDFLILFNQGKFIDIFACSTRAGRYWVRNPVTYGGITGTAVLCSGLYPKTWQAVYTYRFGFKSIELQQIRPVRVGRDGNRNDLIDYTDIQEGLFGINVHIGGTFLSEVDRWSAGCIVIPKDQYKIFEGYITVNKVYDGQLIEL